MSSSGAADSAGGRQGVWVSEEDGCLQEGAPSHVATWEMSPELQET